jgi:uncharacterized membrane protein
VTGEGSQRGQVSLLVVGFAAVIVLLIGVVVDASAAFLRRQAIESVADGAALAAADGVAGEAVYTSGLGSTAAIDPEVAEGYVAAYLARTGAAASFPGLIWRVESAGDAVTVRLSAPLQLPISPPGWVETAYVDGVASAVVPVT